MKKIRIFILSALLILPFACTQDERDTADKPANLTDARIKLYKKKAEQDPSNYMNYNNLAHQYMQKARETGSHEYYKKAEDAIRRSLEITPDNYIGTVLASKAAISMHRFSEALEYAKKALELKPERSFTYGISGDAHLEMGNIDEAERAYTKMHGIDPGLDSYSRLSRLEFIRGNTEKAVDLMEQAYAAGKDSSVPRENIAWTQVMLGLYHFDMGDYAKAEVHYKKSLEIMDNYYLGLEHLAELNAARGKLDTAEKQYLKVIDLNPAPAFYSALADVYEQMGETEKSKKYRETAMNKLEQYVKNGDKGYLRPLARFYAENGIKLQKALELARQDMELRGDIYTYDTLAWMHYRNNNTEKAKELISKALKHGTMDAGLYYHAGMIELSLGNHKKAGEYFEKVLEINPEFDTSKETGIKELLARTGRN